MTDELPQPYIEAIRRGFNVARQLGSGCRPVHFLVGIAEGDGPAADALDLGPDRSLRGIVAAAAGSRDAAGYLHMQAQEAARSFASARSQPPSPEHLLVALIDQGTTEVIEALGQAGLDRQLVRRTALAAVGAAPDEPTLRLPAVTPAGTLDRPALPVPELDSRAWSVLCWRQGHLPLHRVRGPLAARALSRLERDAAWRLADGLQLDDDQRYSLVHHHVADVERRAGISRPVPGVARGGSGTSHAAAAIRRARRRARHPAMLNVTVGWAMWLGNRRADLHYRWFRLRTTGAYRGCPQP